MLAGAIFVFSDGINVIAQEAIQLVNPSFEGEPGVGKVNTVVHINHPPSAVDGWTDCASVAFLGRTGPDIHPHPLGWQVTMQPMEGNTYLGMVVREDETYEYVSQRLAHPLEKRECYEISIYLAKSPVYMGKREAITRPGGGLTYSDPYLTPAILRIWGSNVSCELGELLAQSQEIVNNEWMDYSFILRPRLSHQFIILEATYSPDSSLAYNGHILLDNCSLVFPVPCE